ncbi:hypothetical protein MKW94_025722, partial [Papaver nudicaule]|nr:hypothetical protein [Papaver nudicaule]
MCLSADLDAIQKLSEAVKPKLSGWSGTDPCNWSGIKCSGSGTDARIQVIDLSKQNLSGTLDTIDFKHLTELKTLALQGNRFSGPIPDFSDLENLKEIFLDENNFTSVPPKVFSGLIGLEVISVSDNLELEPWVLPEDLTQSTSLVAIYASKCNLMGPIPDFIGGFVSLVELRLSYNNLTGELPGSLATSSLKNFWVDNQVTGLSGTLEVISKMTNLEQVWVNKNMFTSVIPNLSNCSKLHDLQLSDNRLTGIIPPNGNYLTVPSELMSLPSLVNVSLANNKLMGEYPTFSIETNVVVGGNDFCKMELGLCSYQVYTLLQIAEALRWPATLADKWTGNDACQGWTFVTCDPQKKNVTVINFSKQHFVGTISPSFAEFRSLKKLFLNDNNLTGPIPDSLLDLPELQTIDVTNNNLSGKVPAFPSGKVTLKSEGNPFLGIDLPSDTPGGDPSSRKGQSGAHKNASVRYYSRCCNCCIGFLVVALLVGGF